jgi:hypothetical protein
VLVQTEEGTEPIAQALRAVAGVASAEDLRGPYDAIALAGSAASRRPVEEIVADIHGLPGVTRAIPAPFVPRQAQTEPAGGEEAA